jgi:hypothetical protein
MANPSTPSGDLAVGTTAVSTKPGRLRSVMLFGGSATSSVIVYDNPSAASGTVLARLQCAASGAQSIDFDEGIAVNTGITAVVAGTAAIANICYDRG